MSEQNPNCLPACELEHAAMWEWIKTQEFVAWFESWYGGDADFEHGSELHDRYLSERKFAAMGWLAGRMEAAHVMTRDQFLDAVAALYRESRKVLP